MKKILPILIVIPVLVIAAIGGAMLAIQFSAPRPADAATETPRVTATIMLPMRDRIINTADNRFLKFAGAIEVRATPEYAAAEPAARVKLSETFIKANSGKQIRMEDAVIAFLSSRRSEELRSPEARERLRDELRARLASVARDLDVINIYFTEFVIQ